MDAIKCANCGDTVYSRTNYDMRSCHCESVSIDGGRSYTRTGWDGTRHPKPEIFKLELDGLTQRELYDDWNKRTDALGIIRG